MNETTRQAPNMALIGEKIKRPPNKFMVWSNLERRKIYQETPEMHMSEVSRELGRRWKLMSVEEKAPYAEEAERIRLQHLKDHPDYKYQPMKRKNKRVFMEERPVEQEIPKKTKTDEAEAIEALVQMQNSAPVYNNPYLTMMGGLMAQAQNIGYWGGVGGSGTGFQMIPDQPKAPVQDENAWRPTDEYFWFDPYHNRMVPYINGKPPPIAYESGYESGRSTASPAISVGGGEGSTEQEEVKPEVYPNFGYQYGVEQKEFKSL